ncbi:IucA/IucC family protein [Amycolatopsis sp. K13G38]|uniref:IucA/IucC family protein n=1 Tax=Amycolatopsis acididurans TaxID=2724524 RepID=A0ABX1JB19_9PSEU|nr:IucA/IucC family protein [Amycolatopsis acididurans]
MDEAAAWRQAAAHLTHRLLGELSHEGLFEPEPAGEDHWRLPLGEAVYEFRARRGAFGSFVIALGSATRAAEGGKPAPVEDPRALLVDARTALGLYGSRLAEVLTELTATIADESSRLRSAPTAEKLSTMDYNLAEGHLAGHPPLVFDAGRAGFSAEDRARYAPESGEDIQLRWFAVRRDHARFDAIDDLGENLLQLEELDAEQRAEFTETVGELADYVLLPLHPWQADEIVGVRYAGELASGVLVDLGPGYDHYRPHQTVWTLANVGRPTRRDVTVLPAPGAPVVTGGLKRINAEAGLGLELLGGVAGVTVRHPLFGELPDTAIGALWSEPVLSRVAEGEQALSFAALPYRDLDGHAVLTELIRRSGLGAEQWCAEVLDLLLRPLLGWLCQYGVGLGAYAPNLVLIVSPDGRPLRVAIKDLARGVELLDEELDCHRLLGDAPRRPANVLARSLSDAVFAGQLRYWAEILLDDLDLPRTRFWDLVRETVTRYRADNPACAERFDAYGLLAPEVERVTPNREHLAGEAWAGRVPNPLHGPAADGAW